MHNKWTVLLESSSTNGKRIHWGCTSSELGCIWVSSHGVLYSLWIECGKEERVYHPLYRVCECSLVQSDDHTTFLLCSADGCLHEK